MTQVIQAYSQVINILYENMKAENQDCKKRSGNYC